MFESNFNFDLHATVFICDCFLISVDLFVSFAFHHQVAEFPMKRCVEAGLWTSTGRWTKDDTTETEDMRMMETS